MPCPYHSLNCLKTEIGQILVKIDAHPETDGPEVRFYFRPEGRGVCSVSAEYAHSAEGWIQAEDLFNSLTKEKAVTFVTPALTIIQDNEFGNREVRTANTLEELFALPKEPTDD
jgi:hypothetical protein